MTWVTALILMVLALPALLARLAGGYPPNPGPELAALAPLAVVPAVAAVIIAAFAALWLAALLAIPAALLLMWQLPPLRRARFRAAAGASRGTGGTGSAATTFRLRLFTVNAKCGAADPAAILRILQRHDVDVLAVQELTPAMVTWLTAAGLTQVLPFSHLDPRPGSPGTGLWARWPLIPLPPVPGLSTAAPRARIDPLGGFPVTLTAVHPAAPVRGRAAPMRGRAGRWRRELAMIQRTLAAVDEPQVVAGDFNATRDHGPFREFLAAGFLDCVDASQNPVLARVHLAIATRYAPGPRTGFPDCHRADGPDHTSAPHRPSRCPGRHRVHTGNLTIRSGALARATQGHLALVQIERLGRD